MVLSTTKVKWSSVQLTCVLLLFVLSFSVNFFLIQGIPFFMNGHDVFYHTSLAISNSFDHLFRVLFTDRITTQGGDLYVGIGQRTTSFIIAKGLFALSGMTTPYFHAIVGVIFMSLNTILLFLILNGLNMSKLLAFLGALIYATATPTYSILNHLIDSSLYYHFFILLSFYLFLGVYLKQEKTNPIILSSLIFISALLAIKSKNIGGVVVPLLLFFYCLCVKQNIHGIVKRRIPVFSIMLLYYVPTFFRQEYTGRSFGDLLLNFRTYYFYNPWTKMGDGEQIMSLFSPLKSYTLTPGSLMGIYKFLLGWVFIIFLLFFIISIYKIYKKEKTIANWNYFSFIVLWHLLEVAVMVIYLQPVLYEAIRYVGIATPSFIVLTFYSMQNGLNFILKKAFIQKFKKVLYCILITSIVLSILSNFYASAIQIRGGLLSRHTLIHDSTVVVYKDYFKQDNVDDTIFFKMFNEITYFEPRDKEAELGNLFYSDVAAEIGILYEQHNLDEIKQKIKEKGFVYIATFREDIPFTNKLLLKKISACPPESSLYCKLKDTIKGQKVFFHVFKVLKNNVDNRQTRL